MDPSEFLLEEYKHLTDSFLRNEEMGERRVNLFLTLTTTIIGALAAVREIFGNDDVIIFLIGLFAVLLLGSVTFVRIVQRNLATDEYLRSLARIRRYFADNDTGKPGICQYLPYKPYDDRPQRKKEWDELFSPRTGGLLETVALVNSVIAAAFCGLLAYLYIEWTAWVAALVALISTWIFQFAYSKDRYDNKHKNFEIHFPSPMEIEETLIIISDNPQEVAKKIADLDSIENYKLQPQDTINIHDLYFDTPDMSLQSRKMALRVRSVEKSHLITLKGPSQPTDGNGVERLEIEKPWSLDAMLVILKYLDEQNIKMPSIPEEFDKTTPENILKGMGLKVIQDRETQRIIRNITEKNKKTSFILAEMGIDHVTFKFKKQNIHLIEIEIEAKSQDGSKAIRKISKSLIQKFETDLQRWHHGKLATGKTIEKLLEEGVLTDFLDSNNNLKPGVYEKIDDILKGFVYRTV